MYDICDDDDISRESDSDDDDDLRSELHVGYLLCRFHLIKFKNKN